MEEEKDVQGAWDCRSRDKNTEEQGGDGKETLLVAGKEDR